MLSVSESLAKMESKTLLDDKGLAQALGISTRTVPRWVNRGDLPAGTKLGGKTIWMAGKVLLHIESKMEEAAKAAERRLAAQQRGNSVFAP